MLKVVIYMANNLYRFFQNGSCRCRIALCMRQIGVHLRHLWFLLCPEVLTKSLIFLSLGSNVDDE